MKRRFNPMTAAMIAGVLGVSAWILGLRTSAEAQTRENVAPLDPIARLAQQIDRGELALEFRQRSGYLESLLEHLDVNLDSQVLVFSKTSFQHELISPRNPRAIYFNDTVAIGRVPGGDVLELTALDTAHGVSFYTLPAGKVDKPEFKRRGVECAFCHGPGNHGAPGLVVASVFPDAEGMPAYSTTFFRGTDHRTPFTERWGGWYVTGTHGSQRHLGNAIAPNPERPAELQQVNTQNLTTLADKFDTTRHLSPFSDLVALMTLEHQIGMTNLINSVTARYRRAERQGFLGDALWKKTLDPAIEELVTYMVFADEALLEEPVHGTSTFKTTFSQRGPRDRRGRSLRDFDLQTRLFRYPVSYMIYSEIFDRMPSRVKDQVYRRLHDVLTGRDTTTPFGALSPDARQAALDIIRDTKPTLPQFFWDDDPEPAH
jgi:hypothetical protein